MSIIECGYIIFILEDNVLW